MSDNFTFVSNGVLSTYVYGNQGSFNTVANVAVADEVYNLNVSINTTSLSISNPQNYISITCPNTAQQSLGTYWLNSNGQWSIITPSSLGVPTYAQLAANIASLSSTTSNTISSANAVTANLAAYTTANNGLYSNSSGTFVVGNNGILVTSSGVSVIGNSGITVGPGGVYVNAQFGLIANTLGLFVKANTGLTATADGLFVNSSYLTTYISNSTANNSPNLGGTPASAYQLNSTLAANVATMTANSATYINGQSAGSYLLSSTASSTYLPLAGGTLTGPLLFNIPIQTSGGTSTQFWIGRGTATGYATLAYSVPSGYGIEFDIANSAKMWIDSNGVTYHNNQVQAPSFYDYNDTSYYVDPNSTSNINGLVATGFISAASGLNNETGSVSATNWFRSYNSSGWYNETYGGGIYMNDSTWVRVYNSKQFWASNLIQSDTDVRAPIFYDTNNTGYYVNPDSTSNIYKLQMNYRIVMGNGANDGRVNGIWHWSDSDSNWATYMAQPTVGINPAGATMSGGYWDNNHQVRVRAGAWGFEDYGSSTCRAHINGTGAWFAGQTRSPIYYDSNDTGYYCDPNSTSRFAIVNINVGNWNPSSDGWNRFYFASGDRTIYEGGTTAQYVHEFRTHDDVARWLMAYSGNFYASGDIISQWSDRRMKKNIEKISDWRTILENINGYRFQWNETGKKIMSRDADTIEIGLIAQEVKDVLPQGVAINELQFKDRGVPKDGIDYDPENPYLSVKEEKLIPVLVEAVKAQMAKIDELEEKINKLEALI